MTIPANCGTCYFRAPMDGWQTFCQRWNKGPIPDHVLHKGCHDHVIHPSLFPYPLDVEASTESRCAVYVVDGVAVYNGHADARVFGSEELLRDPQGCARAHAEVNSVMQAFPGAKELEVRNAG